MTPDFQSPSARLHFERRSEPSPFPYWFLIAAWIGFGVFLGVSLYHMKTVGQCPLPVAQVGMPYGE